MRIQDELIRELERVFQGRGMRRADPPDPVATFPAVSEEVGDLQIWDDGEEATVGIGSITHGHFDVFNQGLTEEQRARNITQQVVAFLQDLFADRVVLWRSEDGRSGGWQIVEPGSSFLQPGARNYLWSGPIDGSVRSGSG